jgi:hypothetical protein
MGPGGDAVTETEWDACADPEPMLRLLRRKASDRKMRLFLVACCRKILSLLQEERSPAAEHAERCREAVEVAERYADGLAERAALTRAANEMFMPEWPGGATAMFDWYLMNTSLAADFSDPRTCVYFLLEAALRPSDLPRFEAVARSASRDAADLVSAALQATLLREILGNPFRPAPAVDPSWLAWNDGTVAKLAAAIYDGRRFADLPILADALEDTGCSDAAILAHCRGGGEHVRGCWVVDLLTGRQ